MIVAARVADDFAEAKLSTSLDYLGVPLEVKAKTSQRYVRLAIASVLKAAMVGKERGLVALSWEKELVTTCRQQCKVASEIVEKHKLARDTAIELVRDAEAPEEMLDVIKAKRFFAPVGRYLYPRAAFVGENVGGLGPLGVAEQVP